MKAIPEEVVIKILKDLIDNLDFPFPWGKETLYYFYYFQKGEEVKILNSFKFYREFQNWSKLNPKKLNILIKKLSKIEDLRKNFLAIGRNEKKEIKDSLSIIIEDLEKFIRSNLVPIFNEIQIPKKELLSYENYLWEALSFYLKMSKLITYSVNFRRYSKLSRNFYFKKDKIYKPNTPYKIEEEKSFLQNLLLSLCGLPCYEEVEFSLLNHISLKGENIPESIEFIDNIFIFHK